MRGRDYLDNKKYLAECLAILKGKCEGGNKTAILKALHQCFLMKAPAPAWLRRAFVGAYEDVAGFKFMSWDQAFGRPHRKRTRPKARKAISRFAISHCCERSPAQGSGRKRR